MKVAKVCSALLLFGSSAAYAESGMASYYHGAGKSGEMTCRSFLHKCPSQACLIFAKGSKTWSMRLTTGFG